MKLHALLLSIIALMSDSIEAFADHKLTLPEKGKLAFQAAGLAFVNWKQVIAEYKAMTAEDLNALYASIAKDINLPTEKAKAVVDASLEILVALGKMQKALTK